MSGASTSSTSAMEEPDITHCSICLETYKEPKALPCVHTFCRTCLEQHCAGRVQEVPCPMCRKPFSVPLGGVTNLPSNFFIDELIQLKQSKKKIKLSVNYCEQHPSEPNRLYCYDCKKLTCPLCLVSKHKKHNLTDVDEAAEIFRQKLKRDVDNISAYSLEKLETIKQLENDTDQFMEKIATTESEISQNYYELLSLIRSQKNEMMKELNAFKDKILLEVETVKDEMKTQSVIRDSFNEYVLELMDRGTACNISRTAHDFHRRAKELVKIRDVPDCLKLSGIEIKFKPSLSTTDSVKNFIGELVLRGNLTRVPAIGNNTQKLDLTKLLRNLTTRHVMPCTGRVISGITVVGIEVFIVRCTSQINVYKCDDFASIRNITINGSKALEGLVSCSHYNCLYALDPKRKIIYRYEPTNNVITDWSVAETCYGLSVTKCFNILATLFDTNRIQEYTTHGNLIREISLDSSIDGPLHCVQLSTGNYVVCHVETQHRVCIVNQSGHIIQSYGGPQGSGVGQLKDPIHLTVDIHDNVLVTDNRNHRVQLLSPTLAYLGDIVIPGHKLKQPFTLHFDDLNHCLYIGEWTGGRMFVLDIKY